MAVEPWAWLGSAGGEMAALMRRVDWAATPVGPVEAWPASLKSLVSMMLSARHPMFLWWGADLVQFYNDGYVPSFGVGRHPSALGQKGQECWAEIWPIIGPEIAGVMGTGTATYHEDALVPILRNGRIEEVYWTYGYSPVFETSGAVAGVLVVVTETTSRTVALRRLRTAQTLAEKLGRAAQPEDLARAVVEALGTTPEDAPWSLVYHRGRGAGGTIAVNNLPPPVADAVIARVEAEAAEAPPSADGGRFIDLSAVADLPGTPWPEPSTQAIAVSLRDNEETPQQGEIEVVFGLSPRLPYDQAYRDHVHGLVRQLAGTAQRIALVRDLEAASRAKDEFLAMLGHELRNPLSPIVTALAVMQRRGGSDSRREQDVIGRQLTHMVRLIDDLLEVSRVTRGKIELRRAVAKVADVVDHAVETVSAMFVERTQRLEVNLQPDLRWFGDATRLGQVIGNLLTNAARYTQRGGQVALSVGAEDSELVIRVKDNGEGLERELLPRLFEPFVQGQREGDRRGGGLGLGLAVVKGLVGLHGGTVKAHSAGAGRGSEFVVRVPGVVSGGDAGVGETPGDAVRSGSEGRRRVLVVDDNEDAANLLGELLEVGGHQVAVAFDGPAALRKASAFNPDVALLDLGLPGMDGYQLLSALRQQLRGGSCRFLALTGYGQPADIERAAAAGFERLLVKPIDIEFLERLLRDEA